MTEDVVRKAARSCVHSWMQPPGEGKVQAVDCIHEKCSLLVLYPGGNYSSWALKQAKLFTFCSEFELKVLLESNFQSVKILNAGNKSAAAVHVSVGPVNGWMVMLCTQHEWKCISAVFSRSPTPKQQVLPMDFQDVATLSWDGYCAANRACDAKAMASVFHGTCRLTYSDDDGNVQVFEQSAFCKKVANRYTEDTPHIPFASFRDNQEIGQFDSLDSIEFSSPNVAMVTLKVGHPPFLWTDLLTCAKLEGQWWIVHKSSCSQQHPMVQVECK
jgi:hypothetical protein